MNYLYKHVLLCTYLEWMKEIQFLRVDHHFNIYLPEVAVIG